MKKKLSKKKVDAQKSAINSETRNSETRNSETSQNNEVSSTQISAPGENKKKAKSSNNTKKSTSLRLDKQTLKALKIKAIENETSIQKLIESLIIDFLNKSIK